MEALIELDVEGLSEEEVLQRLLNLAKVRLEDASRELKIETMEQLDSLKTPIEKISYLETFLNVKFV